MRPFYHYSNQVHCLGELTNFVFLCISYSSKINTQSLGTSRYLFMKTPRAERAMACLHTPTDERQTSFSPDLRFWFTVSVS